MVIMVWDSKKSSSHPGLYRSMMSGKENHRTATNVQGATSPLVIGAITVPLRLYLPGQTTDEQIDIG
jgi:hypothetical protein